ncbi:MAG TPA: hypothetical protein VFR24_15910, partial [Candidatus Angelobacter sp.]|nr:hypothetical protein [Candidatus Angelobacter sp.]
ISSSRCSRVRSTRGSRNSAKYFRGFSISPSHLPKPFVHIAFKMRRPWFDGEADLPAERAMIGAEELLLKPTSQAVWSAATEQQMDGEADLRAEPALTGAERILLKPTSQAVWSGAA